MRLSLKSLSQFWTATVLFVNSGYPSPMSEKPRPRTDVQGASEPGEIASGAREGTPPGPALRLPLWVRLSLFALGWLLILVGIAGLVLPGIQGVLTLLVGVAGLSLVSELAYELLRKALRRWPAAWTRVESFREKAHRKLHRFHRN